MKKLLFWGRLASSDPDEAVKSDQESVEKLHRASQSPLKCDRS